MQADTSPVEIDTDSTDVESLVEQKVTEVLDKKLSSLIEVRSEDENPTLEDVWIAGQPLGKIVEGNRERASAAEEKAEQAAAGANGGGETDENALPIQQVTKIWKVGGNINARKTEHAAAVWSDFMDRSENGREVYYLPTDKVEQILREHFRSDDRHIGVGKHIERATVHRAMDALEDLGGEMIHSSIIRNGRRALMINKEEWQNFYDALASVSNDVTAEGGSGVTATG